MKKKKHMNYDRADVRALRNGNICQRMAGGDYGEVRFDSVEQASIFFARELDYIKTQTYDVEYPEMTALAIFPVTSEVPEGG